MLSAAPDDSTQSIIAAALDPLVVKLLAFVMASKSLPD